MTEQINWSDIDHFSESEFPAGVVEKMAPAFLYRLDGYRADLGYPVYPSPLAGGWVRTDGSTTSRHFIGKNGSGRQSDAGDVFPDCDIWYAFITAVRCGFTGIGIYFDTQYDGKPKPMLHLDTRPGGLVVWTRIDGVYETIFPRPDHDYSHLIHSKKG